MDSSQRVKLLAALFGLIFLGSVVYLFTERSKEEEADAQMKETLGKPAPGKAGAPRENYPRCPECGRELPASGECPFCLMKKREKAGGKDLPAAAPAPRLGRYLAWSMIGLTLLLAAVHLGMYLRARRRFLASPEELQLKTKCHNCKRRVRFAARLANTYGNCPTCKQRIQFKPMAESYY